MHTPPQHDPGSSAKRNRMLPLLLAAGVIASIVLAGCASTAKRKWLTVFFDGVPAPGARPPPPTTTTSTNQSAAPVAAGKPQPAPLALPEHKPYQENNCMACHQSKFSVAMRAPLKEVCLACHKTFIPAAAKSIHSPVDSGECLSCHNPHYSVNKKLVLRTGTKLCFDCHDDFLAKAKFKHAPAENGECVSCHNPHASNNKSLLIKESSKLCEDCHEPKDIAAAKGHVNIGKAACLDCHDPHVGNDENLLKHVTAVAKGPTP